MILPLDQIDQIVRAQMSLLTEEHVDNLLAFARAFAAVPLQPAEVW
jgi:hypothetical protein